MDYFRLFYEYFEEKVSDFLFVKSGSVIIFFLYNLVANFAREYESSHDRPRGPTRPHEAYEISKSRDF